MNRVTNQGYQSYSSLFWRLSKSMIGEEEMEVEKQQLCDESLGMGLGEREREKTYTVTWTRIVCR